ncbi:MAG: hypothetical protein A2Y78_11650 [Acidobacteria bacterium RBG_13_68_16]|nr:MAG: hypothetical protein A2Y78_11650 [Acidobacteria bacterium RBG_13_68_16]
MRKDTLFVATMGYLLLPNLIFALGWLKAVWALPFAAVIVACVADVGKRSLTSTPALSAGKWAVLLTLAGFWAVAFGLGGLNAQSQDYLKHNLIFHDITVERWPVVYGELGPDARMLCYYIAYYLPSCLLGKLAGLEHVAAFSFAWGLLGIALAFAWVSRFGRGHGLVVLGVFTLVDSFCWLPGLYPLAQKLGVLAGAANGEWWHTNSFVEHFWSFAGTQTRLLFQSAPAVLVWSPQHAIGAWLATACVLRSLLEASPARHVVLANAAVVLWSPFVGVGLVPFTAWACVRDGRGSASWSNVVGSAALAFPACVYFLGHDPQQFSGVLIATFSGGLDWSRYVLFLILAIGVLWASVWSLRRRLGVPSMALWRLLCLAGLTLTATTFVYLGKYNDWVTRVSLPALFVFALVLSVTAVELWSRGARPAYRVAFAVLLVASAERSLKVYALAPIGKLEGQGIGTTIVTARRYADDLAKLPGTPEFNVASQYLGNPDGFFGRYLMKSPHGPSETR